MAKEWIVAPVMTDEYFKQNTRYSRVVLQLLKNRKIEGEKNIEDFLRADWEKDCYDPFLFRNMAPAVEKIINHIKAGHKILIFGDYDADGVTSAALLVEILGIFHAQVEAYIPHRVKEGYGLSKEAVAWAEERQIKLIITVDGGIRSKEEVALAESKGIEVIITDHHLPPESSEDLPKCLLINPQVAGETYPYKKLAGVGVAFKLAQALISKAKLSEGDKNILSSRLLDLVAIGTVADLSSLIGENRVLVKKGLEILNQTRRLGLKKLFFVAGIRLERGLDSGSIGFQIAPRLNAAGRMDHANTAFELLITKDKEEAVKIAEGLNLNNMERQSITAEIFAKVEEQAKKNKEKIIIGVCEVEEEDEEDVWNEGVIGLVAGKLTEKYYKPALVITKNDGEYKGSGRSIESFNLVEALEKCSQFLDKYGGHAAAAGFTFKAENLEGFITSMKALAEQKITDKDLVPKIFVDMEVALSEVNEDFVAEVEKLVPFGQDNFKPKFLSRKISIQDIMTMGQEGQHVKFRLDGKWALSFGGAERWKEFKVGDLVDLVYYAEINEFNGRREVQLKIVDMKINQNAKIKNQK